MPPDDTAAKLLLSYVSLLAERNAYAPGGGFEFDLFDAVVSNQPSPLLSREEREEVSDLAPKDRSVGDLRPGDRHVRPYRHGRVDGAPNT